MLSKLLHFESPVLTRIQDITFLMSGLKAHFEKSNYQVTVDYKKAGGTLGVCFSLELDGEKFFVKTHLPGKTYRLNLVKEIIILKHLYQNILTIRRVDLIFDGCEYTFLIMDELQPLIEKPNITIVKKLVDDYSGRLKSLNVEQYADLNNQLNDSYNLLPLIKKGYKALEFLYENKLISKKIYLDVQKYIIYGERSNYTTVPDTLCHGDLSNKNILLKNDKLVVIDWEDAFWSTADYDFIYWLTFFDQRRYYRKTFLDPYLPELDRAKYFMLIIVILKCYLSVINNGFVNNTISFDQRLAEIIEIR